MNVNVTDPGRVAAFFDVDGTLVGGPSLELRFFSALRRRGAIPARNYFSWLRHGLRLARHGITFVTHANKMYLRGVPIELGSSDATIAPEFFPGALARVAWHTAQRHSIMLVTGTLAPLAHKVAVALALRAAARGITASIGVCATRLEEAHGRWTGRIIGDAMFGEAKARAIRRIAAAEGFDLTRCYGYGDTSNDRWMLSAVGHPTAVNPSPDLAHIARLHDWPALWWSKQAAAVRGAVPCAPVAIEKMETLG